MFGLFVKKIVCCSCNKPAPASIIKYTHRNGQKLPLCPTCWDAALKVQAMMAVPNRAEAARQRWLNNPR